MERRLDILESIGVAAEIWGSIRGVIIRICWIKSEIIEAPHVADLRAQNDYRTSSLAFKQVCFDPAEMIRNIRVCVSVED